MKLSIIAMTTVGWMLGAANLGAEQTQTATPKKPATLVPINVVAIGYDVEKNPKARKMLDDIAQAAQDSGARGEVILAGRDQAELDSAMEKALSLATQRGASMMLTVGTPTVRSGQKIVVQHADFAFEDPHAWIAFYKNSSDKDEDYLHYTFLRNLNDRTYDVPAPREPGSEYHFRVFLTQEYKAAARSATVTVTP